MDAFADYRNTPEYQRLERNYKLALHHVLRVVFSPDRLNTPDFPATLAAFFDGKLDLDQLGLAERERAFVDDAVKSFGSVRGAFINLCGGGFGVNSFSWVPGAVADGLGEEVAQSFRDLVVSESALPGRIDGFRSALVAVEHKAAGLPSWHEGHQVVRPSLAFVAALLAGVDPQRFTPYHQGKLKKSYEALVDDWPEGSVGQKYDEAIRFVAHTRDALERQGASGVDLIDAQSFLFLREVATRYFILQQSADTTYGQDEEGSVYHFTPGAAGAWKQLAESGGARFVYYRPGSGSGDTAQKYFGFGRITRIDEEREGADRHYFARLADYRVLPRPVPASEYDPRPNVQMSISEIDKAAYEELLRRGGASGSNGHPPAGSDIYAAYRAAGLSFPDDVVTSFLLSLRTKPFVILSGISGTGKTRLAQELGRYLDGLGERRQYTTHKPEDDQEHIYIELTNSRLRLGRTTLRRSQEDAVQLPARGASSKFDVALANGQTGQLRLNNIGFSTESRRASVLFFQGGVREWLRDQASPGQFLQLRLDEDGAITHLDTVSGEVEEAEEPAKRHELIPVRSDWTDPRGLIGFYNPLLEGYVRTPLLDLMLEASERGAQPYLAVLDEMNLARVEYYFSDFLSAMESGEEISLRPDLGADEQEMEGQDAEGGVPNRLRTPSNLLFVGTVNVDETTHAFSPKVLDRANVLEFDEVSLPMALGTDPPSEDSGFRLKDPALKPAFLLPEQNTARQAEKMAKQRSDVREWMQGVHDLLRRHRLHFGYRVIDETCRFIGYALEDVEGPPDEIARTAFDLQLVQKVLPKLAGGRELEQPLKELLVWCRGTSTDEMSPARDAPVSPPRFPRATRKIQRMLKTLDQAGYVAALG